MKFKIHDWYDLHNGRGFSIDLQPGLNILVGPNGSGKTTAIIQINEYCKENNISFVKYDNYTDGGTHSYGSFLMKGDMESLAIASSSSEGQGIIFNLGQWIPNVRKMISNTCTKDNKVCMVLLDAIDSGLDINNINEVKSVFKNIIIPHAKEIGAELYVVISTNNYEFIKDELCFSIKSGTIKKFSNYEEYARFIKTYWKGSKSNE